MRHLVRKNRPSKPAKQSQIKLSWTRFLTRFYNRRK